MTNVMAPSGAESDAAMPARRLRAGDRILLHGFIREIVRIDIVGVPADPCESTVLGAAIFEIRLHLSFLNGGGVQVPSNQLFGLADPPFGDVNESAPVSSNH